MKKLISTIALFLYLAPTYAQYDFSGLWFLYPILASDFEAGYHENGFQRGWGIKLPAQWYVGKNDNGMIDPSFHYNVTSADKVRTRQYQLRGVYHDYNSRLGAEVGVSANKTFAINLYDENDHLSNLVNSNSNVFDANKDEFLNQVGELNSQSVSVGLLLFPSKDNKFITFFARVSTPIPGARGRMERIITDNYRDQFGQQIPQNYLESIMKQVGNFGFNVGIRVSVIAQGD